MFKERCKPSQVGPRIMDKLLLAMSTGRQVDGIWIGSWRTPEDLLRVEQALLLIKRHSPLHHARVLRDLHRIWIYLLPDGLAEYNHSLKACVLDERHVADPATRVEQIASTIIHEAAHAWLERRGIAYREELRARIEEICLRRELAFAARIPAGAELREEIAHKLNWYRSNPDYFGDAQSRERDSRGEIEMLRHVGALDWLIRATPAVQSLINRTRRLLCRASPMRGG